MKKKESGKIHLNSRVVIIVTLLYALLQDIEHRWGTKDFCLFTKENKETQKKSLDLPLHERSFF